MSIERLSGGLTPADGGDPRTFPAIWNGTADDLEAGDYSRVPTGGSAGQVLVKDSATNFDASWVDSIGPRVRPGFWHVLGLWTGATGRQQEEARLRCFAFALTTPQTINAVGVRLGSGGTGTAGAVFRIGVWDSGSNGLPNNLLLDAGTVDCTQPTQSVLTITGLSLALNPGVYWIGGALQGAAATRPFMVETNTPKFPLLIPSQFNADTPDGLVFVGFQNVHEGGVTGAFSSTFTASPTFGPLGINSAPLVIMRFAS
jgi:hypothetical protein